MNQGTYPLHSSALNVIASWMNQGNPDAILRWNSCARILMDDKDVKQPSAEASESMLE